MHYWASRGRRRHLVTHPESIAEVRTIVGADAPVHCVHGLHATRPSTTPRRRPRRGARSACPRPGRSCSSPAAGGASATSRARSSRRWRSRRDAVVCLCGRNDELHAAISPAVRRRAARPRRGVHRGDARLARGCRRARALDRRADRARGAHARLPGRSRTAGDGGTCGRTTPPFDASGWPTSRTRRPELREALERALAAGRPAPTGFADVPSAASFVLAAADAG